MWQVACHHVRLHNEKRRLHDRNSCILKRCSMNVVFRKSPTASIMGVPYALLALIPRVFDKTHHQFWQLDSSSTSDRIRQTWLHITRLLSAISVPMKMTQAVSESRDAGSEFFVAFGLISFCHGTFNSHSQAGLRFWGIGFGSNSFRSADRSVFDIVWSNPASFERCLFGGTCP